MMKRCKTKRLVQRLAQAASMTTTKRSHNVTSRTNAGVQVTINHIAKPTKSSPVGHPQEGMRPTGTSPLNTISAKPNTSGTPMTLTPHNNSTAWVLVESGTVRGATATRSRLRGVSTFHMRLPRPSRLNVP